MWTGLGIELNSEVQALKLLSVNNGVSEAKCHVRSCSSNKMQTNSSFFFFLNKRVRTHFILLLLMLHF